MSGVAICTVAIGHHYPALAARMIREFESVSPGFEIKAWINAYPSGGVGPVVEDGYDYGPYCAKPYALKACMDAGASVALLLDAAFYPIARIHPLIDHISRDGYYLCRTGNKVGDWISDRALRSLAVPNRDVWRTVDEIASGIVGFDLTVKRNRDIVNRWCESRLQFPGHHSTPAFPGKNSGFVSSDSTVRGHRHDQALLSVICHALGITKLSEIGEDGDVWTYAGRKTGERTLLLNRGGFE